MNSGEILVVHRPHSFISKVEDAGSDLILYDPRCFPDKKTKTSSLPQMGPSRLDTGIGERKSLGVDSKTLYCC